MTTIHQPYTVRSLLESQRIHIIGEYVEVALLDRFARLFLTTWRRLPAEVRVLIGEHWRPSIAALPTFAPVRLIGRDWCGSRRSSAFVTNAGLEMAFDGRHFAGEFPPFAAETIAHELAHVYQHATGLEIRDTEADAERLQSEWGFWFGPEGRTSREHAINATAAALEAIRPGG